MDLFVWGALGDPMHITMIIDRTPAGPEPSELAGYVQRQASGGVIVLLPGEPGDLAQGVIWQGITPAERATLDDYLGAGGDEPRVLLRQVRVRSSRGDEEVWTHIANLNYWEGKLLTG